MTFTEVESAMGYSDSVKTAWKDKSIYTLYRYDNRLCNPNLSAWDRCDFLVIFKNGKVVQSGVKEDASYSPHLTLLSLFRDP